nr:TolC family protein [Clostridium chromiireducens]
MKKTLISFLIMTLIASSCISAFNTQKVYADSANTSSAETLDDSTIKVSLENIRDIMTENNLDIKILDNKLKIAKENYDDAKSSYTSKTEPKKEDYTDATTGTFDSGAYNVAVTAYEKVKSEYEQYKNDLKTARDNYDKGVEDQVYSAQQAYITYLYDLSQKNILEETKTQNERKDQIYKIQYDSGFISKNKYTSLLQGNTSTNDAASSKDTVELDRIKLCNTLGISPEEKVIFNTDITQDFQVISKINYEDDLKKMLDNNIEIQVQNDEISDLDDKDDDTDVYDYQVDNANMELKKLINDTETGFKSKYNDLITSYNSVKSSYDVINQKQVEYEITQTKYDYGFVSKNDMDAAKLTLDNDNADFINKRNECYLKYLKYIEMKEGY